MAAVKNGFSVTGQRQTITLDWRTIIKRCDDFSGPINGFLFVEFNSIVEQTCPRQSFFGKLFNFIPFSFIIYVFSYQCYYQFYSIQF